MSSCGEGRDPASIVGYWLRSRFQAETWAAQPLTFRNALAIATRCFSPPDSFRPRSPTIVPYPSGIAVMVSWMDAILAASKTCAARLS